MELGLGLGFGFGFGLGLGMGLGLGTWARLVWFQARVVRLRFGLA